MTGLRAIRVGRAYLRLLRVHGAGGRRLIEGRHGARPRGGARPTVRRAA
jgi:hypothetical protein